jgi:hypothetical protein
MIEEESTIHPEDHPLDVWDDGQQYKMKIKSEEELIKKHKDVLALRGYGGFNCWEGWYNIIDKMLETVSNSVRRTSNINIVQIKEKFGMLRVYTETYDSYTQGIIDMAETLSKHTCERCGKLGELRPDLGWIKTLCLNHYSCRKLELAVQEKKGK